MGGALEAVASEEAEDAAGAEPVAGGVPSKHGVPGGRRVGWWWPGLRLLRCDGPLYTTWLVVGRVEVQLPAGGGGGGGGG
jgi:hypothetical protein